MNVLAEDKITKQVFEKITVPIQTNNNQLKKSTSLRSRQESKTNKKDESLITNSTNSIVILHKNHNKKNKKVTFKQPFEDIVLIDSHKEFYYSNLSKEDEEKGNENNLVSKSEEDCNESIQELDKKFNHKELKNNCSVCCVIY